MVMSRPRLAAALVALVTAAGAWLRFDRIGWQSLWLDEGTTAVLALTDWATFQHIITNVRSNMFLHLLLLRGWTELGTSEAMLRMPSALFGIATIPLLYLLGRRLFDARVGVLAALLLAVSPTHVVYSQEARSYAMLLFLAALWTLLWLEAMEKDSLRSWTLFVVVVIAGAYAHFVALLGLGVLLLSVPLAPRRAPESRRHMIMACAVVSLGVAPILFVMSRADVFLLGWIPRPTAASFTEWGVFLASARGRGAFLLAAALWIPALLSLLEYGRGLRAADPRIRMLHLWIFLPPLLGLAASMARAVFVPRYFLPSLLPLLLLVAVQIARLAPRWQLPAGATLALLLLFGVSTIHDQQIEDWRGAISHVRASARPGDAVVLWGPSCIRPFRYYTRGDDRFVVLSHTGRELWRPLRRWIDRVDGSQPRVWVVTSHEYNTDSRASVATRLQASHSMTSFQQFQAVDVALFERR